jgi:serine/threonine protein kinase
MARVYRAEQAALQRPVALKVLDRWVLEKPQGSQRFLREARAAAAIKHPNVVDIVDVGVWQERPYIVMELLSGSDLETHLAQYGTLSDSAVAGLALPIIAGMMAVHDAGVVHRDIKPSNIFLSNGADGEVIPKVLDFGVSKFNDTLHEPIKGQTKTREIIGTPTYMAPEALNGVKELGPRADQYALGAVLYECAVGRPPFEGETLLELLKTIAVGNIPAPRSLRPELSITLEDAILRAMNPVPKARFETLRDFGRALWPLADDRSRTIWARSFGNGRPTTIGTGTLAGETAGLVLVGRDRPLESNPFGSSWPSARKLSGVAVFLALGALAALYVLRPWQEDEVTGEAALDKMPASTPGGNEPGSVGWAAAPPVVEQRSLLADSARPGMAPGTAPDMDPSAPPPRPGNGPARPAANKTATGEPRSSGALAAVTPSRATKPVVPRRKRPTRAEPAAAQAGTDDDLESLFATPATLEEEPLAAPAENRELDGLFRGEERVTLGANGSPLPE